jgi:soluble cytochrome b562
MNAADIIKEIEKLPLSERISVIEKAVRALRQEEDSRQMSRAARELQEDYNSDKELTAFTDLDMEDFYEPR